MRFSADYVEELKVKDKVYKISPVSAYTPAQPPFNMSKHTLVHVSSNSCDGMFIVLEPKDNFDCIFFV